MANENLRQALQDAGIQPDELAELLQVDDRTIRRWLAGGTPYPRYRAKLARALDRTEHELWPNLAEAATLPSAAGADTLAGYPDADAAGHPGTIAFVAGAREQVDLLSNFSRRPLEQPGLTELLLAKARDGCSVRVLVTWPDHESLAPLLGKPGIEIRLSETDECPVTHRADDQTLTWITFTTDQEEQQLLLHARSDTAPAVFARLTDHFQQAWEDSEPIETAEDIEYHLGERDYGHDEEDLDEEDHDEDAPDPAAGPAPRRWPGRPA